MKAPLFGLGAVVLGVMLAIAPVKPAAANDGPFPMLMNSIFGPDNSARQAPRQQHRNTYRQAAPQPGRAAHGQRYVSPLPNPFARQQQHRQAHAPQRAAPRQYHNPRAFNPKFRPQVVNYQTRHPKGTIVINNQAKFLYLVLGDGKAKRYGIGVGREGFDWRGTERVTRKAQWPDWRPPAAMRKRQPWLPVHMKGGPDNPMGARALYLGSTLYRIHGTNEPWTIGQNISSGCIRMRNQDVIDLYGRVKVGAKVVVL